MSLALLLVALVPALAGGDNQRSVNAGPVDLATVKVFSSGIDLAPKVRYERAVLTVSGVGRTYEMEFDSYTMPSISPFDPAGDLLADGVYTWELQLVPTEETAKRLRASAQANGGEAERPWRPKTGSFAIRGGILATPDVVEVGTERRGPAPTRAGHRRQVEARTFEGQVFGAEKNLAGRAAAIDTDEAVVAGGSETAILKADRESVAGARGRTAVRPSLQTGPDSDHRATELGGTPERPRVTIPKAHELEQQNQRPRSDGKNGRPRSDR